ncbi:MAG: VPLPA-CTERM sorting domain-containing protein [Pseudomonadota bacterium]
MFTGILKLTSAAALGLGLMCSAASAVTVFDFTGSNTNLGPDETYVEDGITLDVTSFGGNVFRTNSGIGVSGAPDGSRMGTGLSNGTVINESLTFAFSPAVTLLSSIVFEHRDGVENFDILDADGLVLGSFALDNGRNNSSRQTISNLNFVGSEFTIRHTSGSGIRISELTVAAVPLPAGLPLALVRFGGLALVARRRKFS